MVARLHQRGGRVRWTPFAYGFRPFFLAAIAYGLIGIVMWMGIRATGVLPLQNLPPQLWHGHEMLFGFIGAAIAGFLLTAVPGWTGGRGFAGWPLMALSALWLAGRMAFALGAHLPVLAVAAAELSFLPALALMIAFPLLRARNRNTPLLLVIAVLWFVDATFMCALARGELALAAKTLHVGIDVVLLLITVIGGRIVPAFTASALRQRGIAAAVRSHRFINGAVIAAMIAVIGIDTVAPSHRAAAVAAGIAAVGHAIRLAGWQGARSIRQPIVWVLHLAYLWLPVGLALKAIHLSTGAGWAADWLHALTIGTAGTMIVAVITRAALGHTGRPLVVSKLVAVAYGVLGAAALVRAFATALTDYREWAVWAAGTLWVVAFAVLLVIYAPILLRPRVDGRQG
jgi:uncharacterized protein involved in response to NO